MFTPTGGIFWETAGCAECTGEVEGAKGTAGEEHGTEDLEGTAGYEGGAEGAWTTARNEGEAEEAVGTA